MDSDLPIDLDSVQKWESQFFESPKNVVAQNACSKIDPFDVCMSRKKLQTTNHVFEFKVDNEGKPMTDQKNSGRCWIFAALNCLRIPFMKSLNVEEFEFSQSYLFYWDKIERSNYFLHNIVQTANRGEKLDGRLVNFLLSDPIPDGGQWDMFVNLVKKHGLVPKKLFPESFCSGKTIRLNTILKSKLREFGRDLRAMVEEKRSSTELQNKINEQMQQIYKIVGICLGIPPSSFTWEYQDKSKCYKAIGPVTPLEFYENHVRPIFDVNVKVCLVTDPRPENPYQKSYTIDCLGNVVGGRKIFYNNQPVELMMDLVMQSIKSGEPVWFGCDVTKRFAMKPGIEDLELHDFKTVFDCDIQISLNKAERLKFGESAMTHAMLFTGVSTEGGKPTKFRVENSWGEDSGEKGYLVMSAQWFKEFVYEIVVDQKFVPDNVMDIFALDPVVLPAWDPMGTLAQ